MKFKCSCGNETFIQQGIYEVNETVNIEQSDDNIEIVALSMEIVEGSQEYMNEFRCIACNETFTMTNKDNKETIDKK